MAGFKLDRFSGLMPRVSPSLLPKENATIAKNCEFAYGELRNVKGNFNLSSFSNSPKSIYTDDGISFYTWTDDVNAVRSPLSADIFNRLYYTTGGDFRVTNRAGMKTTGGIPNSSYRVGVPKAQLPPELSAADAVTEAVDSELLATFWYEYAGIKYQEQQVALTELIKDSKWNFVLPANNNVVMKTVESQPFATNIQTTTDGVTSNTSGINTIQRETFASVGTPANAAPVVRLISTNKTNNTVLFDTYTANSSLYSEGSKRLTITDETQGSFLLSLSSVVSDVTKETRAYCYTYVNTYGEEGAPSPAASITANQLQPISIEVFLDPLAADYAPIKEIRIYRTPTGSEIADYFYVGALQVLTDPTGLTFIDDVAAGSLNEPLASDEYYPPDPSLTGLMLLPNGILCAWKGNELHFSDAYKPHSWPPKYQKTFANAIVGGIVSGSGALITTKAQPFLISGVSPDSMTETKIKASQAGISKWSMADLGGVLLYASNDGIVAVEGTQAVLSYSEQFFTRDVWRELYRNGFSSMRFMVWDGRLIVYSSVAAFVPFMIRLDEAKAAMTELPELVANCDFVSPLSDQSYFVKGDKLYQFAAGSDIPAIWQSREMEFRVPCNFGMAQAIVTGNWSIDFYAYQKVGGVDQMVLKHTKALTTGQNDFRLPSGFMSDRWQVKISGVGRFRELRVGTTANELKAM